MEMPFNAYFASTAPTKPTGIPITRAGWADPFLIRSMSSNRAVGALPMTTMPSFISEIECCIATVALVLPKVFASSITDVSAILQTTLPPNFSTGLLLIPDFTMFTSVTIFFPLLLTEYQPQRRLDGRLNCMHIPCHPWHE